MSFIRSILAALIAILVANPACCCTVKSPDQPAKTAGCCGGTKKDDKKELPDHCACHAKNPKQVEDPPVLPAFTAIELPPVLERREELRLPEVPVREVASLDFRNDTGPPLRRLAWLQRFLI